MRSGTGLRQRVDEFYRFFAGQLFNRKFYHAKTVQLLLYDFLPSFFGIVRMIFDGQHFHGAANFRRLFQNAYLAECNDASEKGRVFFRYDDILFDDTERSFWTF